MDGRPIFVPSQAEFPGVKNGDLGQAPHRRRPVDGEPGPEALLFVRINVAI